MDDQTNKLLAGYLSEKELARELQRSYRTMIRWRVKRQGPPVTMIGNRPMYSVQSARDWLRSREIRARRDSRNK